MSFPLAVGFTTRWEGGKIDDPADPGGRTNVGVTQSSFANWLRQPIETAQDVWTATPDQIVSFYRDYWTRMGGPGYDQVDERLSVIMFDASVQHGNSLAVKFLQHAMQVTEDGKFGPNSFQRLHLCAHDDLPGLLLGTVEARKDHYMARGLVPQLTKFLHGWLARADDVQRVAQCQPSDLLSVVQSAHDHAKLPMAFTGIP